MYFREFNQTDIDLFSTWLHKEYIRKWYNEPQDWLIEVKSDEFSFIHHFIVEENGFPIGFCQYYDYAIPGEDWHVTFDITDTYSIDYLVGEEAFLGKGYGKKIVEQLVKKIFEETNAMKVIVQPDEENAASRNTLLSTGFQLDEENNIFVITRDKACQ